MKGFTRFCGHFKNLCVVLCYARELALPWAWIEWHLLILHQKFEEGIRRCTSVGEILVTLCLSYDTYILHIYQSLHLNKVYLLWCHQFESYFGP